MLRRWLRGETERASWLPPLWERAGRSVAGARAVPLGAALKVVVRVPEVDAAPYVRDVLAALTQDPQAIARLYGEGAIPWAWLAQEAGAEGATILPSVVGPLDREEVRRLLGSPEMRALGRFVELKPRGGKPDQVAAELRESGWGPDWDREPGGEGAALLRDLYQGSRGEYSRWAGPLYDWERDPAHLNRAALPPAWVELVDQIVGAERLPDDSGYLTLDFSGDRAELHGPGVNIGLVEEREGGPWRVDVWRVVPLDYHQRGVEFEGLDGDETSASWTYGEDRSQVKIAKRGESMSPEELDAAPWLDGSWSSLSPSALFGRIEAWINDSIPF